MKLLVYSTIFLSLAFSSFCQSYSKKFNKSFNLQVGTGLSVSDGALGQAFIVEPQLSFANNTSVGFEVGYKNFKWFGTNRHKLNSFLLTYQVRKSGSGVTPYFSGRMGYFRLHRIENSEKPSYGTFGGGLTSGVFISTVNIGIEMYWYSKGRPVEGSGGVFVKLRF